MNSESAMERKHLEQLSYYWLMHLYWFSIVFISSQNPLFFSIMKYKKFVHVPGTKLVSPVCMGCGFCFAGVEWVWLGARCVCVGYYSLYFSISLCFLAYIYFLFLDKFLWCHFTFLFLVSNSLRSSGTRKILFISCLSLVFTDGERQSSRMWFFRTHFSIMKSFHGLSSLELRHQL